jgi:hypothetical protein
MLYLLSLESIGAMITIAAILTQVFSVIVH